MNLFFAQSELRKVRFEGIDREIIEFGEANDTDLVAVVTTSVVSTFIVIALTIMVIV